MAALTITASPGAEGMATAFPMEEWRMVVHVEPMRPSLLQDQRARLIVVDPGDPNPDRAVPDGEPTRLPSDREATVHPN